MLVSHLHNSTCSKVSRAMLLFLVGYAGSGKSSLGKRLSRALGMPFIDTDKRVEESEGATIADIFYYEGESYFRSAERSVVEAIAVAEGNAIIATGGGLPTWQDNMAWLNAHGTTLYISRSAEQILSRLSAYGREKRPMFRGKSDEELLEFMRQQMGEREPYYAQASMVVDGTQMSDDDIVAYITDKFSVR